MIIAGIDYSLRGPSICVFNGDVFTFDNCTFYYLTDTKKYTIEDLHTYNLIGENFNEWNSEVERYKSIADWALEIVLGCQQIAIEGYSYNSTGKVFHIAENTGVLKYKLYEMGIPVTIIEPTVAKKYATGKGNADKEMMYKSFLLETGIDLRVRMNYEKKEIGSPISDIVDSYFICKKLFDNISYSTI